MVRALLDLWRPPTHDAVPLYDAFGDVGHKLVRGMALLMVLVCVIGGTIAARDGAPVGFGFLGLGALAGGFFRVARAERVYGTSEGLLVLRARTWRLIPWSALGEPAVHKLWAMTWPVRLMLLRAEGEPSPIRFYAVPSQLEQLRDLRGSSVSPG